MKAAIFDLDGLLIDSEPFWRRAEQEIFGRLDVELDNEMCARTTGLRVDEVVAYWHARKPWKGCSQETVARDIVQRVVELVRWHGEPLPGALTTIEKIRIRGLGLAVASSSPRDLIEAALERLGVEKTFGVICSGAEEARGKPDPAVYLTAAKRLGFESSLCLAFEDSIPGVRAAKAAKMTVIAVPAAHEIDRPEFDEADLKLRSLLDFSPSMVPAIEGPVN
jgi:sugar-phosphatase